MVHTAQTMATSTEATKPATSTEVSPAPSTSPAISTASNAASRSASASVTTLDKKRPAESPAAPPMTKTAAAKSLSSLKIPKAKNQSQYVRFKSLLLKDAKDQGDAEISGNITRVAKDAWSKVKCLTPPPAVDPATNTNISSATATSNLSEDVQRYLRLKGRAIKEEQDDMQKFNAEVRAYCTEFIPAATSLVQWETIEATGDNYASLVDAVQLVVKKCESSHWSSLVDKAPLTKSLQEAKTQLAHFRELSSERNLISKLRNATDDELAQHVKEHRRLLNQAAELNKIKLQKQAADERRRQAEELELLKADSIPYEITKALSKQMKYTDSSLKYSSVKISYTRGGVSQKVFAKAFDVAVGTKKATIAGHEVGTKSLRYGAYLECSDVNVKLVGEELVAQTSYFMTKM